MYIAYFNESASQTYKWRFVRCHMLPIFNMKRSESFMMVFPPEEDL